MSEFIRLLNLPRSIEAITITSDGFWLGQERGDCGFNAFFGKPRFGEGPGRDRMRQTWKAFTFAQKRGAVATARRLSVQVRAMLGEGYERIVKRGARNGWEQA